MTKRLVYWFQRPWSPLFYSLCTASTIFSRQPVIDVFSPGTRIQIVVQSHHDLVVWKSTSLLIAWSHCFLRFTSSGKQKKEIFSPTSWSHLSFFMHSGMQQCVGISQPISKEKKGPVGQSYPLHRLIGSFPLLSFKI